MVELRLTSFVIFYGRASRQTEGCHFTHARRVANASKFRTAIPQGGAKKLQGGIVELLGGKDDLFHAHFIGQLLGLDFASSPSLRDILNDPTQIRHRAFQSFAHFF